MIEFVFKKNKYKGKGLLDVKINDFKSDESFAINFNEKLYIYISSKIQANIIKNQKIKDLLIEKIKKITIPLEVENRKNIFNNADWAKVSVGRLGNDSTINCEFNYYGYEWANIFKSKEVMDNLKAYGVMISEIIVNFKEVDEGVIKSVEFNRILKDEDYKLEEEINKFLSDIEIIFKMSSGLNP